MSRDATFADRLRRGRERSFVGRTAELELFRDALEASEPPFSILFVHGPGGVGKTAVLGAIADLCEAQGIATERLDLRAVEPSPPAFEAALRSELAVADGAELGDALRERERLVLLLDTYESAAPLDAWLRERLLPRLPAETMVVIAGRAAPAPEWLVDAGWRHMVRAISLRNLRPEDAREYLSRAEVPAEAHDRVLELTHGHPLALSLLVEVVSQRSDRGEPPVPDDLAQAPDAVGALLARFVDEAPSARHRRALEACAHARDTTEALLRAAVGDDAGELFEWLRQLSFVEEGPRGLFPHDLARDVLVADLRWRDPSAFSDLHRRVRGHVLRRIDETGGRDQDLVVDFHFLHRGNPFAGAYWDWTKVGAAHIDRLRDGDHDAILAITERHEGAESAAIAAHWLERQPHGFAVFRSGDEVVGFTLFLDLEAASDADISRDPGAEAMWSFVCREAPPGPGEGVCAGRLLIDRDAYQGRSPSFNLIPIAHLQRIFMRPRRAWDLIGPWTDPDHVAPLMSYIDFDRVPAADYEVGGRRYAVFARDWRRLGLEGWLDLLADREIAEGWEHAPRELGPPPELALSHPEFSDAVHGALRDLHRDAALVASPLLRSRLVRERAGGEAGPDALRELVEEAVASLRGNPRDEKLERALTRTYLRPAPTQEAAAEVLGLPFSTYRRHLKRGIERVTELLWSWELYGQRGN